MTTRIGAAQPKTAAWRRRMEIIRTNAQAELKRPDAGGDHLPEELRKSEHAESIASLKRIIDDINRDLADSPAGPEIPSPPPAAPDAARSRGRGRRAQRGRGAR